MLARVHTSRDSALAGWAGRPARSRQNSPSAAAVLSTPITAKLATCRTGPGRTPAAARSRGSSPYGLRSRASGSAPAASARPSRHTPFRSSAAVRTMSTRELGSSTQSTGTSWIRRPARSASTSISVSKNHPVSSTIGQQPLRHVAPDRLETALRVGEPGRQRAAQDQVVGPGDHLALRTAHHPRATGQPGADRQVGVAGDQRRDQRQQCVQVGRQVHVHVRQHRRVGGRPRRPAAPARGPSPPAGSRGPRAVPPPAPPRCRPYGRCSRCPRR